MDDQRRLTSIAKEMLKEAQSAESTRIFSATGFARENISIVHQQQRCANLAWALGRANRIRRGDVVAVVGGSFSGLMLACSLAIANDVIVYIFEKEHRLLHRFLDKSHRYLSPNLNSRTLGVRFDPTWSSALYEPAIFRWRAGVASDVAAAWLNEFELYRRKLPIFTFLGVEVTKRRIKANGRKIEIGPRRRGLHEEPPIEVDLLIDATGFGEESNPHKLVDFSYWESGHRLIYDHLPKGSQVLVSGCGDSGIIELMHYAIGDFHHEFVESLWPRRAGLEELFDVDFEQSTLAPVLRSEEVARYGDRIISELCWWLDAWWHYLANSIRPHPRPIFRAIEGALGPSLSAAFPNSNRKRLSWEEREAFVKELPLEVQLSVRSQITPIIDDWISCSIANLVRPLLVGKYLRIRKLHRSARPGISVTLNGLTPAPYTRQMSRFNVWLTHVMMTFPNVRYRRGRIVVNPDTAGRTVVTFDDGSRESFTRVVTRYGVAGPTAKQVLSTRASCDPHTGNWLLTPASYHVPTANECVLHRVEPAIDHVARQVARVCRRRGSNPSQPVDKAMYKLALSTDSQVWSSLNTDERYRDPQTWLSSKLRSGIRPAYVENLLRR